jgi:FkbM family methyltransferase
MHFSIKYINQRLYKKYKQKGIRGLLISIYNFINSQLNPKIVGEMPFKYLFIKKRRLIMKFANDNLDKLGVGNFITLGNYTIDGDKINNESIIYTFGVGTSISFEEKISKKFNCKVYCYDPTSIAKNFMHSHIFDKNKIKFLDYGLWIKDEKIKFYHQDIKNTSFKGGSITNLFKNQSYDLLQCYKLKTLMKQNNHQSIDILKLDIEGAAIRVLHDVIDSNIWPNQIIAEFEYAQGDKINEGEFNKWSLELNNLLKQFRNKNYKIYHLPRISHGPYSTIEVLIQKNL